MILKRLMAELDKVSSMYFVAMFRLPGRSYHIGSHSFSLGQWDNNVPVISWHDTVPFVTNKQNF